MCLEEDDKVFGEMLVSYDALGGRLLAQLLIEEGITCEQMSQAGQWVSFGTRELEAAIKGQRFLYDSNPVLTWCMGNVKLSLTRAGMLVPNRSNPEQKIDAFASTVNAINLIHRNRAKEEEEAGFGWQAIDWE